MSLVHLRIKPRQTCQHLHTGNHTKPLILSDYDKTPRSWYEGYSLDPTVCKTCSFWNFQLGRVIAAQLNSYKWNQASPERKIFLKSNFVYTLQVIVIKGIYFSLMHRNTNRYAILEKEIYISVHVTTYLHLLCHIKRKRKQTSSQPTRIQEEVVLILLCQYLTQYTRVSQK